MRPGGAVSIESRRPNIIEFSVAITALVVSVASLFVARHQSQAMDRQLAASVWPQLEYTTSNVDDNNRPGITFELHNRGVGPLRIRSMRVSYNGRPMRSGGELVRACCAAGDPGLLNLMSTSYVLGRVMGAGTGINFISVPADTAHRAGYRQLDRERFKADVHVCYCSVLEECWIRGTQDEEPHPVKSCVEERKLTQYK